MAEFRDVLFVVTGTIDPPRRANTLRRRHAVSNGGASAVVSSDTSEKEAGMPHLRTSPPQSWRRITPLRLLLGVALVAGVSFGAAQALATPGSGAVSTYMARGPVSQSVVIGVPRTATATKTVRFRVRGKVVTKRVKFTYQTVTPMMTCSASAACDTAYQQLTIPPGGYTGWHTHPGPTFVAVAQGEGTLYHGMSGCPSTKYATGAGFMQPQTEVHNMRNEGSTQLVLWAFYALPPGTANSAIRVDQPQPAECSTIP